MPNTCKNRNTGKYTHARTHPHTHAYNISIHTSRRLSSSLLALSSSLPATAVPTRAASARTRSWQHNHPVSQSTRSTQARSQGGMRHRMNKTRTAGKETETALMTPRGSGADRDKQAAVGAKHGRTHRKDNIAKQRCSLQYGVGIYASQVGIYSYKYLGRTRYVTAKSGGGGFHHYSWGGSHNRRYKRETSRPETTLLHVDETSTSCGLNRKATAVFRPKSATHAKKATVECAMHHNKTLILLVAPAPRSCSTPSPYPRHELLFRQHLQHTVLLCPCVLVHSTQPCARPGCIPPSTFP